MKEQLESNNDGERQSQRLKSKHSANVNLALMARVFVKEETKAFEESNQNSKKRTTKKEECNCNLKYETWKKTSSANEDQQANMFKKAKSRAKFVNFKNRLFIKGECWN